MQATHPKQSEGPPTKYGKSHARYILHFPDLSKLTTNTSLILLLEVTKSTASRGKIIYIYSYCLKHTAWNTYLSMIIWCHWLSAT